MTALELFVVSTGMGIVGLLCKALFLMPDHGFRMPRALREGLRYAPVAALASVAIPAIVVSHGELPTTWKDARIAAALVGLVWYRWRGSLFGTIACGMAVLLGLRFVAGWS